MSYRIVKGDAIDLVAVEPDGIDLIVTDPPYAFGGEGLEHSLSATVAVVLREAARKLKRGGWMVVMCASSWRSISYMVDSVRGVAEPVRLGTWCKPAARTRVQTQGWRWASVTAVVLRKGRSAIGDLDAPVLDHVTAPPLTTGRRAQLPPEVAQWAVTPYATTGGRFLDPFAGSGALVKAAHELGMMATGFDLSPSSVPGEAAGSEAPDLAVRP